MERVEQDLRLLSEAMTYPATPAIAAAISRRLGEAARYEPQRARIWQLALAGAAATVVLAAAIAGSIAPARDAVADFFDRINIFETDESIKGLPTEITGAPLTLEEAEARLGAPILLPAYPEGIAPQRVLLQDFGEVNSAVIFFRHPNGATFALFETSARIGKGISGVPVGKGVPDPETQVTTVPGLGSEAYWLKGLRIVQYYDPQGNVIPESVRATDVNTLIWDENGFVFRLEGDLSQEEAVRIARSLH
jgi:hypothetical protein